jgi:hypothetical protein
MSGWEIDLHLLPAAWENQSHLDSFFHEHTPFFLALQSTASLLPDVPGNSL